MPTLLSGPVAGTRRPRVALALLLLLTLVATTAGCKKDGATGNAQPAASQGLSNVDGSPTAGLGGIGGSGTAPATPNSTTKPAPKPTVTKLTTPAGPYIDVFAAVGNPGCGSPGGPGFPPVTGSVKLTWRALGGPTMVGLSMDSPNSFANSGHGSYSDYPAKGTDTLPFVCTGSKGNKTHTYTLDTLDGGTHVSKTITLTAYWEGA